MRSLGERLNKLRLKLIQLKCGSGAAILPPDVTRIHMDFAASKGGGHVGARKFWKEQLPRLKYHNPSVPMIVNRHKKNEKDPIMTVYLRKSADGAVLDSAFSQPGSSIVNMSPAQPPTSDERVVHIDMKNKHSSHILDFLLAETKATALQPTKEDIAEMQYLDDLRRQGAIDRERLRLIIAERKKEEEMLKRARAAGGLGDDA
jgi:large subunit ribosomal protein MRP49